MMLKRYLSYLLILLALMACRKEPLQEMSFHGESLILFYTIGHNNGLSGSIAQNLNEILEGELPSIESAEKVVLFLQHSDNSAPCLMRLGIDHNGKNISRIISLEEMNGWNTSSVSSSTDTLAHVLNYISRQYQARHNYLVFSSHGSGWLPAGVYEPSEKYTFIENTFGQDLQSGNKVYEMGIRLLARQLPMHFDAILFDACLMGGVEVAYELKDKCNYIGFSPTEIMSHGMYYQTMCGHLLKQDVISVAKDYMHYYRNRSGSRCGCYTIVDCSQLEVLAQACKPIFAAHQECLANIPYDQVQGYFRDNKHWYYDLQDVIANIGVDEFELESFNEALEKAVLFADHTDTFLGLKLERCCGLSTYLSIRGTFELDEYYQLYQWNIATGYVQ
ncbi:MAG: hypothetical protein J6X69_02200 [Bacteroidales bacterium]|nr:hypothetical protein [Bacteroidales bacterium]